ncbi:MAG: basic secretory protein-like protein [Calditrichia bacterium]
MQYYDFKWNILETTHFNIYYYEGTLEIAKIGAQLAEESYLKLEKKFGFSINKKIPLIFYSTHQHFQQTNVTPGFVPEGVGGFFEFLKGRVVLPANGNLHDFKHVITHELVHVFMFYLVYHQHKIYGRSTGMMPPLWFVEGLAEYWSKKWDSVAEIIIRDAVLNNTIVPLKGINRIYGSFMMYKEGESICQFIAEQYGEEALLDLMKHIWKYENFEDVFIETLGMDYEAFDNQWIYHLKKTYYPELKEYDLATYVHPPVVKNGFNMKPTIYVNDTDTSVIFYTNRTGYSDIVKAPLKLLAFDEQEEISVLVKGERDKHYEAFHLFNSAMDINKKGTLVFSVKSEYSDLLYGKDIENGKMIFKKRFPGITVVRSPSISDNDSLVVFSGISFSGQSDIYVWDRFRDTLMKITDDFYYDDEPEFSPDGKKLVFVSDRWNKSIDEATDLFLIDLSDRTLTPLTRNSFKITSPDWSTQERIYFLADRDYNRNVYSVHLPTNDALLKYFRHTRLISGLWDIAITPNRDIVYSVFENQSMQFRLIKHGKYEDKEQDPSIFFRPDTTIFPYRTVEVDDYLIQNAKKLEYKSKFQLDFAQSQVSQDPFWGTQGGAALSFSDVLSNQRFNLLLYNNATTQADFFKSINFALSYINLKHRINYAAGAYRLAGRFYNFKDQFFFEDRVGGFMTISYPLSHFNRIDLSLNFGYSDKEVFGEQRRYSWLYTQYLSYVFDNSLFFVTGPLDGTRFNITVGQTTDWRFARVHHVTYLLDFRKYVRLGTRSALAFRLMHLGNSGRETRWYFLGGSWDLRGYSLWSLRGDKVALMSTELRFPFFDLFYLQTPVLPLYLSQVRGAVFVDVGNAWNGTAVLSDFKGAVGVGWRVNVFGFLVLRFDIGKKYTFRTNSFSDAIFTQFFFGWDF